MRLVNTKPYQANQPGVALHWLVGTRVLLGTRYHPYQAGHPLSRTVLVSSGNQPEPTARAPSLAGGPLQQGTGNPISPATENHTTQFNATLGRKDAVFFKTLD